MYTSIVRSAPLTFTATCKGLQALAVTLNNVYVEFFSSVYFFLDPCDEWGFVI